MRLKKYLVQCKYCGYILFKSETGILFNTQIKCSQCKCKKILNLPEDVILTLDRSLEYFGYRPQRRSGS